MKFITCLSLSLSLPLSPSLTHTHTQYGVGQDEGGRGVTTIQTLIQAFKIAERSSPGFCEELVQRTVAYLQQR